MAFFKSLVKQHGVQYFEPVGKALEAAKIKKPSFINPSHLWALRKAAPPYAFWLMRERMGFKPQPQLPQMPEPLRLHAQSASRGLQRLPREISGMMMKHQLKLADRQCRMSELSSRAQKLVVMLCTSLYAANQENTIIRSAADILCQDLRRELTGKRPSDGYFKAASQLGEAIAEGGFPGLAGVEVPEILMKY